MTFAIRIFCFGIDPLFGRDDGVLRNEDSRLSKPIIGIFVPFLPRNELFIENDALCLLKPIFENFVPFLLMMGGLSLEFSCLLYRRRPVRRK